MRAPEAVGGLPVQRLGGAVVGQQGPASSQQAPGQLGAAGAGPPFELLERPGCDLEGVASCRRLDQIG